MFPCNQFGRQEPGTAAEVQAFAERKFGSRFVVFDKINVKGADTHPAYQFLKQCFPGDPTWNFSHTYFVNGEGVPCAVFNSGDWDTIEEFIKSELSESRTTASAI